ncbi:hypothetical protein BDA99DRAFT_524537 [Phascolomyces articulosus]|uniref:Uncharacterized protein n=1 Tax=Phascolomyces articulosus TaxID=60185 RepID=A0AAD5JQF7_9FUNG|nr:hypothetical protein BDA99DRAFT_524537 [Phascolomyces articulosus]
MSLNFFIIIFAVFCCNASFAARISYTTKYTIHTCVHHTYHIDSISIISLLFFLKPFTFSIHLY